MSSFEISKETWKTDGLVSTSPQKSRSLFKRILESVEKLEGAIARVEPVISGRAKEMAILSEPNFCPGQGTSCLSLPPNPSCTKGESLDNFPV